MPQWAIEKCCRMVETALWRGDKERAKAAIDAIFKETGRGDKIEDSSSVAALNLPGRIEVILERERIYTVGALRACTKAEIEGWWMSGAHMRGKIQDVLGQHGIKLRDDEESGKVVEYGEEGEIEKEEGGDDKSWLDDL